MVKEEIETRNFTQIIEGDTRFWPGQKASAIDQCWVSEPQKIISSMNKTRSVGDHNLVGVTYRIKGQDNSSQNIMKRNRKSFDVKLYRARVKTIDWNMMYKMEDVTTAYGFFEEKMREILDDMAPMQIIQPRRNPTNWISDITKAQILLRDQTREEAASLQVGSPAAARCWENYKKLRNGCNARIKKDKKEHMEEKHRKLQEDKNTKGIYQYSKKQMGWKSNGPPTVLLDGGKMRRSPKDIANIQMNFFHEKIINLRNKLPDNGQDPLQVLNTAFARWKKADVLPSLKIQPVSLNTTVGCLKKLSNGTSFGTDKIDALSVKVAAESLVAPLNYLTNLSISQGKFCTKWKTARIIPLHKGGG